MLGLRASTGGGTLGVTTAVPAGAEPCKSWGGRGEGEIWVENSLWWLESSVTLAFEGKGWELSEV